MAVRIERQIEAAVTAEAIKQGWFVRKLSWVGRRAAPDRLMARNGRCLFVEFKAPGEKLRPDQVLEHMKMKKAGMLVFVVDDIARGYDLLRIYGDS